MRILEGISIEVDAGELVCLLGGNASGKSTTLKTILGIVRPRSGRVMIDSEDVTERAVAERIARGLAIVPENRRLFGYMSVRENLELGAVLRKGQPLDEDFDRVHTLFPRLHERADQLAGTLSGGEQQMVAMGRALMSRPRLLLMDEPSMGLSPALVQQNFRIIKEVHESGVAILVVEQNATMALTIADRGYVLATGEIVLSGPAANCSRARISSGRISAADGRGRAVGGNFWRRGNAESSQLLSGLDAAAVEHQRLAVDRRGRRRGEVHDRVGDLVGFEQTAERRALGQRQLRLLGRSAGTTHDVVDRALCHLGPDERRADRVDADAGSRQLGRDRAGQTDHGVLGGRVGRRVRGPDRARRSRPP